MFTKEEIYKVYNQFKDDLGTNNLPSKFVILAKKSTLFSAEVNNILPDFFELYINEDLFYNNNVKKKYLIQILYHEFTHVLDELKYSNLLEDHKLLFPYTEFHASQIEILKMLDLFNIPNHQVTLETHICDISSKIVLNKWIENNNNDFLLSVNKYSKDEINKIIFKMIYNIGHYSILHKYDIDNRFPIPEIFPYIKNEYQVLVDILLNEDPSIILCIKSNAYIFNITKKIFDKLSQNK